MPGDAGRLVGEYEQHPLRQQTSYLPISAVGGAQFVLKPPRMSKSKPSNVTSVPAPTPFLPPLSASMQGGVPINPGDNVALPRCQPNPEDVLIEFKQEEEEDSVTASIGAISIVESNEHSRGVVISVEEDELSTTPDRTAEMSGGHGVGGTTAVISLNSAQDFMCSVTNTFAGPGRPSRKVKKYPCDVCGQIFTRSGDVKRHKASRHKESAGCICPYCGRVLTRYFQFLGDSILILIK